MEEACYELVDKESPAAKALLEQSGGHGVPARAIGLDVRTMERDAFSVIEPGSYNLHHVTAKTCCAFFDVFTPP